MKPESSIVYPHTRAKRASNQILGILSYGQLVEFLSESSSLEAPQDLAKVYRDLHKRIMEILEPLFHVGKSSARFNPVGDIEALLENPPHIRERIRDYLKATAKIVDGSTYAKKVLVPRRIVPARVLPIKTDADAALGFERLRQNIERNNFVEVIEAQGKLNDYVYGKGGRDEEVWVRPKEVFPGILVSLTLGKKHKDEDGRKVPLKKMAYVEAGVKLYGPIEDVGDFCSDEIEEEQLGKIMAIEAGTAEAEKLAAELKDELAKLGITNLKDLTAKTYIFFPGGEDRYKPLVDRLNALLAIHKTPKAFAFSTRKKVFQLGKILFGS